jgi:hypothetical protein
MVLWPRVCALALVIGLNIPGGPVSRGPVLRRAARYDRPPAALVTERAWVRELHRGIALVGTWRASAVASRSTAAAAVAAIHPPEPDEALAGSRTARRGKLDGIRPAGTLAGPLPARGPPV